MCICCEKECQHSLTGKHCFCQKNITYRTIVGNTGTMSSIDVTSVEKEMCCWCGHIKGNEHGPYKGTGGYSPATTLTLSSSCEHFTLYNNQGQSFCNVYGCRCSENKGQR